MINIIVFFYFIVVLIVLTINHHISLNDNKWLIIGACAVDSDCEYGGTCNLTTLMCMCATGYTGTTCGTGKISSNLLPLNSGFASPFDHQIKDTV